MSKPTFTTIKAWSQNGRNEIVAYAFDGGEVWRESGAWVASCDCDTHCATRHTGSTRMAAAKQVRKTCADC